MTDTDKKLYIENKTENMNALCLGVYKSFYNNIIDKASV